MNCITNKTVLLDLRLTEGKETSKVAIRESFFFFKMFDWWDQTSNSWNDKITHVSRFCWGLITLHHFKSLFRETFEFSFWCSRSQSDIPIATKAELVGREGSFILISSKFLDKIAQTKIEFIISLGWDTVLFCISISWCRLGWLYWCIVT